MLKQMNKLLDWLRLDTDEDDADFIWEQELASNRVKEERKKISLGGVFGEGILLSVLSLGKR